jgi:hypothetical protein
MPITVPSINNSVCQNWSPQERNLYNRMPFWIESLDIQYRKVHGNWEKFLGSIPWKPNNGDFVTTVIPEAPPVLRQVASPSYLHSAEKVDIIQHRERTNTGKPRHHKIKTPQISWSPSFLDFMKNKIAVNLENLTRSREIYTSLFYRTYMFNQAPALGFAGGIDTTLISSNYRGTVDFAAPMGDGDESLTSAKTADYLKAMLPLCQDTLTLGYVKYLCGLMSDDMRAEPYKAGKVSEDSVANDKFMLVCSNEAIKRLPDDPLYKELRPMNEDTLRGEFKLGFSDFVVEAQNYPLRALVDNTGAVSFPAPEETIEDPTHPQFGETVFTDGYRKAQFELGHLVGNRPYDVIKVGAPPADWARAGMSWNGAPYMTDDILINCGGNLETNVDKKWLQGFCYFTLGIMPVSRRNHLPFWFRRSRGTTPRLV